MGPIQSEAGPHHHGGGPWIVPAAGLAAWPCGFALRLGLGHPGTRVLELTCLGSIRPRRASEPAGPAPLRWHRRRGEAAAWMKRPGACVVVRKVPRPHPCGTPCPGEGGPHSGRRPLPAGASSLRPGPGPARVRASSRRMEAGFRVGGDGRGAYPGLVARCAGRLVRGALARASQDEAPRIEGRPIGTGRAPVADRRFRCPARSGRGGRGGTASRGAAGAARRSLTSLPCFAVLGPLPRPRAWRSGRAARQPAGAASNPS
ncbi:hypothetical protein JHFBIEKO_4534 [Methylobacterium mesophilicum]|nr:hypothetical protein JHFBIEKO_4534 [Methylobacterium mesophilicum]